MMISIVLAFTFLSILFVVLWDAINFDRRQSEVSARITTDDLAGDDKPSIQERPEAVTQFVEEEHNTPEAADTLGVGHVTAALDPTVASETDGVEPSPASNAVVPVESDPEDIPLAAADADQAAAVVPTTAGHQDDVLPAEILVPELTLDGDEKRVDDMDASGVRDAIASEIELEISKAVKAVPGCEDFRGVIIAFARSKSHSNWDVRGIKFGTAERAIASDAIATVVARLQQKFKLVEGN